MQAAQGQRRPPRRPASQISADICRCLRFQTSAYEILQPRIRIRSSRCRCPQPLGRCCGPLAVASHDSHARDCPARLKCSTLVPFVRVPVRTSALVVTIAWALSWSPAACHGQAAVSFRHSAASRPATSRRPHPRRPPPHPTQYEWPSHRRVDARRDLCSVPSVENTGFTL